MLVDYIEIEQKIPATTVTQLNSPHAGFICFGETAQFKATVANSPNYPVSAWKTSSNLSIVSQNSQTVTVKATGNNNGPGWV